MGFRPNINYQCGNKGSSRPGPSPTSQPLFATSPSAPSRALRFWCGSSHILCERSLMLAFHALSQAASYCPWVFPWSSPLDCGILWARVMSFCLPSLAPSTVLRGTQQVSAEVNACIFLFSNYNPRKNPNSLEYQLPGLYKELVWPCRSPFPNILRVWIKTILGEMEVKIQFWNLFFFILLHFHWRSR